MMNGDGTPKRNIRTSEHGIRRQQKPIGMMPPRSQSSIPTKYETIITSGGEIEGFNSSSFRFGDSRTAVPGPGSYDLTLAESSNPSISSKGYGYGMVSKQKRWYDAPHQTFNPPGPGNYELTSQPFKHTSSKQSHTFIKPSHQSLTDPESIIRSDPRNSKLVGSKIPGPGAYNVTDSFVEKKAATHAAFKSKTRREYEDPLSVQPVLKQSAALFRNTKSAPRTNVKEVFIRKDETLPNAVFRSETEKETFLKQKSFTPHPNADSKKIEQKEYKYEARAKYLRKYETAPSSVFATTGKIDRFGNAVVKKTRKFVTPGPGSYNVDRVKALSSQPKQLISSSYFMSNTERFSSPSPPAPEITMPVGQQQLNHKKSFHKNVTTTWL